MDRDGRADEGEFGQRPTAKVPPGSLPRVAQPTHGACLVGLTGPLAGQRFTVGGELLVGRGEEAGLRVPCDDASRRHLRVSATDRGEWVLEDLDSTNKTLVNGEPVKIHVLRFGDTIQVGARTSLLFTHHNAVAEEQLDRERLDSASRLAAGVAHHFNNLSAVFVSNVRFLRDLPRETRLMDGRVQEVLRDLEGAGARLTQIVRNLLAFSRGGEAAQEQVDLTPLLHKAAAAMRRRVPAIEVEVEVADAASLLVEGSPAQLEDVLTQLCLNALDALGGRGKLNIAGERRWLEEHELPASGLPAGDYVVIGVRDTGAGMDAETARRAFDPFYTTKEPTRSTGLGLAAVHGIVREHAGHVQLESDVEHGTTFWVYLPARQVERAEDNERQERAAAARPLALVGASEEDGGEGRAILEQLGFDVEPITSGRALVMAFLARRLAVSAVVVDVRLDDLAPREILRVLRLIDPKVKVVFYGPSAPEGRRKLRAAGASFVATPLSPEGLEAALADG